MAMKLGQGWLNLESLSQDLTDQQAVSDSKDTIEMATTVKAQAAKDKAARDVQAINNQAQASAAESNKRQADILGDINGQLAKAKEAIALSDSQNPLDRVQLWLLQQSDSGYTRDGNLRRIEYYQKAAEAVGGMENVTQAQFSNDIKAVNDQMATDLELNDTELTIATLTQQQGQARIDAHAQAVATQAGVLQNAVAMQNLALTQLPDDAIAPAIEAAKASPDQATNVGGITIPLSTLQSRDKDIQDRKYAINARNLEASEIAVNTAKPEDILKAEQEAIANGTGFALLNGVQVSQQRLTTQKYALQSQEFQAVQTSMAMDDQAKTKLWDHDRKILSTMNVEELRKISLAGGWDETHGFKYDPRLVTEVYNNAAGIAADDQAAKLADTVNGDPMTNISKANSWLDSLNVPANSTLGQFIESKRGNLSLATGVMTRDGDSMTSRLIANTATSGIIKQVNDEIDAYAKDRANGDKDLETIYQYTLRNQPVPTDEMLRIIDSRAGKKNGLVGILSQDKVTVFNQTKMQAKQTLMTTGIPGPDGKPGIPLSDTDAEAAANQMALDQVKLQIAAGAQDSIMYFTALDKKNPINAAGMQPGEFLNLTQRAEEDAKQGLLSGGVKQEDLDRIVNGGGTPQENDLFFSAVAAHTMKRLDAFKPGMAKAYMQYWASPDREAAIAGMADAKFKEAAKAGTQSVAEESLIRGDYAGMAQAYNASLGMGDQRRFREDFQKDHLNISQFGADPIAKQVFLLEQDKDLTDSEKQLAFLTIKPFIAVAQQNGYNAKDTSAFIESQLRVGQYSNPETAKVMKKVLAGRDAALTVVDNFIDAHMLTMPTDPMAGLFFAQANQGLGNMNVTGDQQRFFEQTTKGFPWYAKLSTPVGK